ncbi:MAG: ABC transporter permease, partial [Spirochaetales bacterium]|nr:ABC transporter permease [Spirochaetales bacterium]
LVIVSLTSFGSNLNPRFLTPMNIGNILSIAAILAMATAGQTLVMVSGAGVDISIGAMMSLVAIISVEIQSQSNAMILPSLLVVLAAGAFFGLLNGLGAVIAKVPALVLTFAMASIIHNVQLIYTRGTPQGKPAPLISFIGTKRILPWFPCLVVVLIGVTLLMIFLLRFAVFGKQIYASGSNQRAAEFAGIRTKRVQILTFVLSGMFSGFAGFWFAAFNTFMKVGGANYLNLPALAAVLIGGTSFAGGEGSYKGSLLGALTLTLITSLLVMVKASEPIKQVINGTILIFLLILYNREPKIQQ